MAAVDLLFSRTITLLLHKRICSRLDHDSESSRNAGKKTNIKNVKKKIKQNRLYYARFVAHYTVGHFGVQLDRRLRDDYHRHFFNDDRTLKRNYIMCIILYTHFPGKL